MSAFSPAWLRLREPADADARAVDLVDALKIHLNPPPLVVRDIGCGTGSLGRWLAGRLPGPQHWVLHDRDARLLALARSEVTGPGVTVEAHVGDLAALTAADLAGTSLVTASALLDVLTAGQVRGLAAACAGRPALFALSVVGRVEFASPEPLDARFQAAFNDHQRRGGLLGPDAVGVAAAAFAELGARVTTSPSPWRLGPERRGLAAEWLRGWVGAAVEQEPDLADVAPDYLRRRLAGGPEVVVHHEDLLAVPG
ncbi:class I SAM-dependent methyltransferase [Saccharothrix syringae]|uniref:Class I SAM-dependent methyltransferase n=1 Tax=Saccharothrix syringae TaxID=103733 RepID=A0A5Q0GSN9_SACSY|nr:class I SAM-dependent methyltransferase [Saccharothrix syringae]QFZ16998.1 class I SAM-dependent methyltransferase [Saccharothrix syringae]